MKVSIITATLNNRDTIEECLNSIHNQTYHDIEHVIIDGGSTDGTLDILRKYEDSFSILISEPDNGIYDALNKGIKLTSGDIIGFLHADDMYSNDKILETIVSEVIEHNVDSCYGDLLYVSKHNADRTVRHWKSRPYERNLLQNGWMPPHPTFYVKKEIYKKYGMFNTNLKIAADYELMLRFLEVNSISAHYIPQVLIKMKAGGASTKSIKNILRKSYEDYRARKINNLQGNYYAIFLKNLSKIPQFVRR